MARIPYADINNPAVKKLADQIVAERGSIIHLYGMLLNSPHPGRMALLNG